jgi:hypothetical protein
MNQIWQGGDRLIGTLQSMLTKLRLAHEVSVGFLENSTYPDGTSTPLVAAVQEFGSARIPSRPFFRNMIAKDSPGWPDATKALLKADDYNAKQALGQMGELIRGQLQQSILDTNEPPLAPATVKRKGFSKPLVDTSHMMNSVDYRVE